MRLCTAQPPEEDRVLQDPSTCGPRGFLDAGDALVAIFATLQQHFGVGGRLDTKPQVAFFMRTELRDELAARSRFEMPKADTDQKAFCLIHLRRNVQGGKGHRSWFLSPASPLAAPEEGEGSRRQ